MITLAIDTSTNHGSVAALHFGKIVIEENFTADRSHSAALFACLERVRAHIGQIDLVAIGLGPGSYAGVRIAISAALGFQIGLGALVVGVPSVVALDVEEASYIAIGDARRESFYFTLVENGECSEGPLLATERELRDLLNTHPREYVYACEPLASFPTVKLAYPSAVRLARMAADGIGIVQQGELEPIYLREPYITQAKA